MADNEIVPTKSRGSKIPVWVWILGGTVLVAGIYFYRKNAAASAASAASNTSGATTPSTDDTSGLATDQYEQLLAQVRDLQGQVSDEAPAPATAASTTPPVSSVSGKPPTSAATPGAPAVPPAPVKTAPAPAKPKTVTTAASPAWNSTLAGIAQKEYGSQSAANINKLWTANQALIEGQEIKHGMTKAVADQRKWLYPGEVLTIP